MLSRQALTPQERQLYSKLRLLLNEPPGVLRGNLVETRQKCGKKRCRCATDSSYAHRVLFLGISLDGKRRMLYIPVAWEVRVRQWVQRHSQIRDALEQLSRAFLSRLQDRKEGL
jgi:hypothetical protein